MAPSASFLDYVKDLFSPFGEISVRKMFGGAGIYCDGAIFAISGDDDVWFKVDDVTRAEFEAAGLRPFEVEMNGKTGTMSYYNAPEEIYDDNDALRHWTSLALAASARGKKPAKKSAKTKTAAGKAKPKSLKRARKA
ncbi:TfoX/Sxy family protein [Hyphococcus sp.]|uniref:TfoX/Sxy family protein n=1 Tax=Hyphococcus sp. TaxID=2038636 RepID=UPI003D0F24C7